LNIFSKAWLKKFTNTFSELLDDRNVLKSCFAATELTAQCHAMLHLWQLYAAAIADYSAFEEVHLDML
jgi:hypothetical protein